MNRIEMGRVMAHLLRHRRLDTTSKRKARSDERDLALLLSGAGIDERAELEGVLQGFGFDLAHFDEFKTQGIAPGGQVFLLGDARRARPGDLVACDLDFRVECAE